MVRDRTGMELNPFRIAAVLIRLKTGYVRFIRAGMWKASPALLKLYLLFGREEGNKNLFILLCMCTVAEQLERKEVLTNLLKMFFRLENLKFPLADLKIFLTFLAN